MLSSRLGPVPNPHVKIQLDTSKQDETHSQTLHVYIGLQTWIPDYFFQIEVHELILFLKGGH